MEKVFGNRIYKVVMFMKENIKMIKKVDLEYIIGIMEIFIKVFLKMI